MASHPLPAGWTIEHAVRARDLEAIVGIEQASFANPWTREMFEHEFDHAEVSRTLVVRTPAAAVAGFCIYWVVFDEIHINNLAVRPDRRREGLGEALLRATLTEAAASGGRRATLEVRRSNASAIRLYERFGFRPTGVRAAYYSNPAEDALVLELEPLTDLPSFT